MRAQAMEPELTNCTAYFKPMAKTAQQTPVNMAYATPVMYVELFECELERVGCVINVYIDNTALGHLSK